MYRKLATSNSVLVLPENTIILYYSGSTDILLLDQESFLNMKHRQPCRSFMFLS